MNGKLKKDIPILITFDIDPAAEVNMTDKYTALDKTIRLLDSFGIKSTFFTVANVAVHFSSHIRKLRQKGHEVGCHGLIHGLEEEYNRMSEPMQRSYLTEATEKLEEITGEKIRSFRGPRVKTSHVTQKILTELNYWVDSSVCSQRVDFISSNLINPNWIRAPRFPYHPNSQNAFKRGNRKLYVIPVSALILPFISSTLYAFGIHIMKILFRILYQESKYTGKPVVYLMHPFEFAHHGPSNKKASINHIFSEGFSVRRRLKLRIDENKRYEYTRELFKYIASFEGIRFITVSSYIQTTSFGNNGMHDNN